MKITLKQFAVVTSIVAFSISVESFAQAEKFKQLGDSAYGKKNYVESAQYYEKAIESGENASPRLYYNLACVYALSGNANKSLQSLEKSFQFSWSKTKRAPVGISDITSDSDLNLIRTNPRFTKLLNSYYSPTIMKFVTQKEISYDELLNYMVETETSNNAYSPLQIEDKIIYWKRNDDASYLFNDKTRTLVIPGIEKLGHQPLQFVNCTFKLNFVWANFFKAYQKIPFEQLAFINCTFEGRFVLSELKVLCSPKFVKCWFMDEVAIHVTSTHESRGGFVIDSCNVNNMKVSIIAQSPAEAFFKNCYSTNDSLEIVIYTENVDRFELLENKLDKSMVLITCKNLDKLKLAQNHLGNIAIQETAITSEFDFNKNEITGKLMLHETYFSIEPVNDIQWKNLDNLKLGYLKASIRSADDWIVRSDERVGLFSEMGVRREKRNITPITGENENDISDDQTFAELMGMYSMFLNLYKNKYDIESYNQCLIAMKDLQSKRLKILYQQNDSFNNYFRWKLSQLMKFYVRHGTDPARAIVISIYIILTFGVFFFFFPSDWDITSKGNLIQNFKDFVQKNEKGYLKPFFILTWGFMISLFNAFTLSLNAFITLGFGNIPTHGLARYVCILEGSLGWFLLSIFTVALINQVL